MHENDLTPSNGIEKFVIAPHHIVGTIRTTIGNKKSTKKMFAFTNVSAALDAVNFRLIPFTAAVAITLVDIFSDFF